MLDVRKLVVLIQVVESGSITAAAQELSYTPSAVSQQLQRLEAEAGQPLLRRRPRGVTPTEAGLVLVGHARKVLRQLHAAQSDLDEMATGRRGSLVVGAFPTVAASFLPQVVEAFRTEYPDIDLSIRSARFDALLEDLERGRTHITFLWDHPWRPFAGEGLRVEEIYREPFVVMVSAQHRLADAGTVRLADLREDSWVVRAEQHPVVEVLDRFATQAGFRPDIALYSNDYQETQALVSVGIGVALAPAGAVVIQHPGVRVLSLGPTAPERRVLVAQREERVYSTAETAFRSVLWRVVRDRLTGRTDLPG